MQDAYLFGCVKTKPPARGRPRDGSKGNRINTFSYTVNSQGHEEQVCLNAFMNIHAIGKKRMARIKTSKASCTPPIDKRGMHGKHVRKPEEVREQVQNHIRSFPKIQSHYFRHDNQNKHYLHLDLNINRMWLLYLEKYEPTEREKYTRNEAENTKPIVTYSFYDFGRPKSDTCLICDRIATCLLNPNIQDDERDSLTREKELPLRKAESAYKLLSEKSKLAKTNSKYDVFTCDFQQNLPCPNLTLSDIFYTRLLWTYNFGVHDCSSDDGIMHIWSEHTAARGSSEVCSSLMKNVLERKRGEFLVFFSDGCGGQNKNKSMNFFCQKLVEMGIYKSVDHIFSTTMTYVPA